MSRSARIARPWALTTCSCVLVAAGLSATSAAEAGATTPVPPLVAGPRTSVTILLKAPNQAGLNRLSVSHGLSHSQRVGALAALLPSRAVHDRVADELRQAGYSVVHQTAWTITARAATTTVVHDFGTPASARGTSAVARLASSAALPRMPAELASLASTVLPSAGANLLKPLAHRPTQAHSGADFRNAYTAPGVSPETGVDTAGPLTIATLQFTGWNKSDLAAYAAAHGLDDPLTSGQYVQIPVNQASVPTAKHIRDGTDEEVDLDQEALLSTAPNANQRAYFSPNSSAGSYVEDLSQVLADVTQGTGAYHGGDPKIVALSTSWGFCEGEFRDVFNNESVANVEDILKSLTAAGVTVFAPSGDSGVYDCAESPQSTRVAVDYPASSPVVVAVGGTNLVGTGQRGPNTGHNWSDTAWGCTSTKVCEGSGEGDTGGSGGGESKVFGLPTYQAVGIGRQSFVTTTHHKGDFGTQGHRLVPDIAADGDPKTGFALMTSDRVDDPYCDPAPALHKSLSCPPVSEVTGGTSLAAPETAALFTNMLGSHGVTAGVGDIHPALYSAYAAAGGSFRDVTSGRNGAQADVDRHAANHTAYELPVTAQVGYDTVTGLGAALWPRIAPFIFAPAAPHAEASLRVSIPQPPDITGVAITAKWHGVRAASDGSAPSSASIVIDDVTSSTAVFQRGGQAVKGSRTFTAEAGDTYTLTVSERDLAGQHSSPAKATLTVPYDDPSLSFTPTESWSRVAASRDIGGSHATTTRRGATATITRTGSRYAVVVRTGPSSGVLDIDEGSAKIGSYDLYSAKRSHHRINFFGTVDTPRAAHTFSFRDSGKKTAKSTGTEIDLDAVFVG
jgi:hypothetical protein